MTKPITPEEVSAAKTKTVPPEVFTAFNAEIAAQYDNGVAVVEQDKVIDRITEALSCHREHVFENKYLDVEDAYRAAGWDVVYEKPTYSDCWRSRFKFRRKQEI